MCPSPGYYISRVTVAANRGSGKRETLGKEDSSSRWSFLLIMLFRRGIQFSIFRLFVLSRISQTVRPPPRAPKHTLTYDTPEPRGVGQTPPPKLRELSYTHTFTLPRYIPGPSHTCKTGEGEGAAFFYPPGRFRYLLNRNQYENGEKLSARRRRRRLFYSKTSLCVPRLHRERLKLISPYLILVLNLDTSLSSFDPGHAFVSGFI